PRVRNGTSIGPKSGGRFRLPGRLHPAKAEGKVSLSFALEPDHMKIRAVIFDIYRTLLDVGPPPSDSEARWVALWLETFNGPPRLDLGGFRAACDAIITREHAAARAAGIAWPEVYWPDVIAEV